MTTFSIRRVLPVPPAKAWAVLTDAKKLSSGPCGITRLDGTIAIGHRLTLWTEATKDQAFRLKVTTFEAPKQMVWEGGMPLGLFKGVRRFSLTPQAEGVIFEMSETFSGLMAPLIVKSIPDLTPSFERFADGLTTLAQKE